MCLQSVREQFGHVDGMDWGEVVDLMPTACAGRDDNGSGGLALDFCHEGFGDLQGEIIFRLQRAKGTGHAAAARLQ